MIAPAGRKLGKYEIRQKLGRGGMADVYLAQDTELGRPVALKLIEHSARRRHARCHRGRDAAAPSCRPAWRRSIRAWCASTMRATWTAIFFVAMEYIDGQDLAELMRRGPLAVEFAADVAHGRGARRWSNAHKLRSDHRRQGFPRHRARRHQAEEHPHRCRGEVRVLDFGIAKALSLSRRLTRNEFGSVPYASPERLDTGEVNAHSDLWSLAVMLYEMVTGLQPYQADTTERLERMIRSRIPPPPAPDPCPEPLRRILMKAMAPDPELRYQSAREFADDLAAFRTGAPVRAVAEDLDATRRTVAPARRGRRRPAAPRRAKSRAAKTAPAAPLAAPAAAAVPHGRASGGLRPRHARGGAAAGGFASLRAGRCSPTTGSTQRGQEFERDIADRADHRSGPDLDANGRNFPGAIPRLCYCRGRASW